MIINSSISQVSRKERIESIGRHIWFNGRTEESQARYYYEALVLEFGPGHAQCSLINDGYLVHARPESLMLGQVVPSPPSPPLNRHDASKYSPKN